MKYKSMGITGRAISLLLAAVMVMSLFSVTASAEGTIIIDNVEITGVVTPIEGETPKYDCILPADCGYYIDEICWIDSSYVTVDDDETFIGGKEYYFVIYLYPEDGYSFKDRSELTATVNGEKASKIGTYANEPELRIIYKKVYVFHKL